MMPTGFPRLLRSTTIGLLRGLRLTLATAATVWLSAPTVSHAGPIVDYVFSNASAVLNGVPLSYSGFFEFDPLTHVEWEALIQVMGPAPYAGTCFLDTERALADLVDAMCPGFSQYLTQFHFANDLSSFAADRLDYIQNGSFYDFAPTGFALPPGVAAPVPEPTSLALLSVALGLIFPFSRKGR